MGFRQKFIEICEDSGFTADPDQLQAIDGFEDIEKGMAAKPAGFMTRIFGGDGRNSQHKQGVYLFGDVGRGKSFVMDAYFEHAQTPYKVRQHFHEFMLGVHDSLHAQRQAVQNSGGQARAVDDALLTVADDIARDYRLICFDEMFVEDVADAMILGRLFTALFQRGVHVVMTSNIAPDDLYKNGLQRDRFMPFIALLKDRMHIVDFDGDKDYRSLKLQDAKRYIWPIDKGSEAEMRALFETQLDGADPQVVDITVKGRVNTFDMASKTAVLTGFDSLCRKDLGPEDYLTFALRFQTVFLTGVPQLTDKMMNETRRVMMVVDTLYEKRVRLFINAAVPLDDLYQGDFYKKPFRRTLSRLREMQSSSY